MPAPPFPGHDAPPDGGALPTEAGIPFPADAPSANAAAPIPPPEATPTVPARTKDSVVSLALGRAHSCAVLYQGGAACWGANDAGQLGDGTTTDRPTPPPRATSALGAGAGGDETCILAGFGGPACAGKNDLGQIGNGTTTDASTFLAPRSDVSLGASNVVAVGSGHACTLHGGDVYCWGDNTYGQLGDGTFRTARVPVRVTLPGQAVSLTAGARHTCATLAYAGSTWCWGDNRAGQLGNGTSMNAGLPVQPMLTANPYALALGASHTCAQMFGDGGVQCWGDGEDGQLGNGDWKGSLVPVSLGIPSVLSLAAGDGHTCAILADRSMACWGRNTNGALGNGTTARANQPTAVTGIAGARSVAAGAAHTCAVVGDDEGRVLCWGANARGQLGNGKTVDAHQPVEVAGIAALL
jgi:alpha-tubulin suppressor-like RCC1 family protein